MPILTLMPTLTGTEGNPLVASSFLSFSRRAKRPFEFFGEISPL